MNLSYLKRHNLLSAGELYRRHPLHMTLQISMRQLSQFLEDFDFLLILNEQDPKKCRSIHASEVHAILKRI